jgi:hypothetical protein
MSTPVKRIEKDFLLKVLYDEQIPVMYLRNRTEYILTLTKPVKDQMVFKPDRPVVDLKNRKKIDLMFDYRGNIVSFSAEVVSFKDDLITALAPDYLYKDLDRSYSRVQTPSDLQVEINFLGDRYSLSYPKINAYDSGDIGALVQSLDPKNLTGLIGQLASWIKGYADGYKMVIFKDVKPSTTEERVVAETGKALYLPTTMGTFPESDPYPKGRLITEEIFKRYLETTGIDFSFVDEACSRFIKAKSDEGFFSDLWVPILFQEYVIGYIHLWINKEGKLPFDFGVIDSLYQFTAILASSLKMNGYFEGGKLKTESFGGKVIDISASGLLFVYPQSPLANSLLPDIELSLKLTTDRRTVNTNARIVRRYKDTTQWYFGIRFLDMAPEDMRFLFEYIYGKTFTDTDAAFLSGQV